MSTPPGWRLWRAELMARCEAPTVRLYARIVERAWRDGAFDSHEGPALWIASGNWSRATRATYAKALRSYLRWERRHRRRLRCRPRDVPKVSVPQGLPRPLSDEELRRLLDGSMSPRTRLWVRIALLAGLRAAEIAGLRAEDIDLEARTLRVRGKGNKTRVIPLHPDLALELAAVDGVRGALWPGVTGGRVSGAVDYAMTRQGITGGVHRCRHWYASSLLGEGADLRTVQTLLGHASVATTEVYTAVRPQRMAAAVAALTLPSP